MAAALAGDEDGVLVWLHHSSDAGDLGPSLKDLVSDNSMLGGWNTMTAEQEEVVDPVVGGKEPLCLAG